MQREFDAVLASIEICQLLWIDSRVPVTHDESKELERILETGGVPSKQECEYLVMGNEHGEIPESLELKYPELNAWLSKFF